MSRKRKIFLIAGAVALALVADAVIIVWYLVSPSQLRAQAERELRALTGAPATIRKVSLSLFRGITLRDVRLPDPDGRSDGIAIQAAKIRLRCSFWDLLRGVVEPDQIEIVSGELALGRHGVEQIRTGEWALLKSRAETGRVRLVMDDTQVRFQPGALFANSPALALTGVGLTLTPSRAEKHRTNWRGSARSPLCERLSFRGTFDSQEKFLRCRIAVQNIALKERLRHFLPPTARPVWDDLQPTGAADVTIGIRHEWKETPTSTWELTADLKDAGVRYREFPIPVRRIEGQVICEPREGVPVIQFREVRGQYRSARLKLQGLIRDPGPRSTLELTIFAGGFPLEQASFADMPEAPRKLFAALGLDRGRADVRYDLRTNPRNRRRPDFTARAKLKDARLRPEAFPYELSNVAGEVEWDRQEIRIEKVTGQHGDSHVAIQGKIRPRAAPKPRNLFIHAKHLQLDADLRAALSPKARQTWDRFQPSGAAEVWVDLQLDPRPGAPKRIVDYRIRARGIDVSATYEAAPYPIEHLTGELEISGQGVRFQGLEGKLGTGTLRADGEVVLSGEQPRRDVSVTAKGISLDDRLREILPPHWRKILDASRWQDGTFAVSYREKQAGREAPDVGATIQIAGAKAQFEKFPLPLTNINGSLQWDGKDVRITELRAAAGTGQVFLSGGTENAESLTLKINARDLPVDEVLRAAAEPWTGKLWPMLSPGGVLQANCEMSFDLKAEKLRTFQLSVSPRKMTARYAPFPYPLTEISGMVFADGKVVQIENLSARAGDATVQLSGRIVPGDPEATRLALTVKGLALDPTARKALPADWQTHWDSLKPKGKTDLHLNLQTGPGGTLRQVDGTVRLDGVRLRGKLLPDLEAKIEYDSKGLRIPKFQGAFYGGGVSGNFVYETAKPPRYQGKLAAYKVNIRPFFKDLGYAKEDVAGEFSSEFEFTGVGDDLGAFTGRGSFQIEKGKLWKVTLVEKLLGLLLKFKWTPDDKIQEARVKLHAAKKTVHVDELLLMGTGVPIRATGTVSAEGELDLICVTTRGKESGSLLDPHNWPLIGAILREVNRYLPDLRRIIVQIRVTGTLKEPQARLVPFRGVTKPLIDFVEFVWTLGKTRSEKK